MVIAESASDLSLNAAMVDRVPADIESGRALLDGQPSLLDQTFFEALDFGRMADPLHAYSVEGVTGAGAHAALVEDARDLSVGVFVHQKIKVLPHVLMSGAQLLSGERARKRIQRQKHFVDVAAEKTVGSVQIQHGLGNALCERFLNPLTGFLFGVKRGVEEL
jgi:hypothetical protein